MKIIIVIFFVILVFVSIITAYWGPRKWLLVSAISSFLMCVLMNLTEGYALNKLLNGIFWGIIFMIWSIITGISVRFWKEKGRAKIRKNIKILRGK